MTHYELIKIKAPDYVASTPVGTVFTEGYHFFKTSLSKNYNPQTGGASVYGKYYRMAQIYQGATFQIQVNGTFTQMEHSHAFEKYVPLTWNAKTAKSAQIEIMNVLSFTPRMTGTITAAPTNNKTFTISANAHSTNDVLMITSGTYKGWWCVEQSAGSSTLFNASEKVGNLSGFNNATYEILNGNGTYTEIDGTAGNFKGRTYKGMIAQWALMDPTTLSAPPVEKKNFTVAITVAAAVTLLP